MTTCRQVEKAIVAFVDGEASQSERIAIEQHVQDCSACAGLVRDQRALSSELFHQFSDHKRTRSLRSPVLSHLPEMDMTAREVEAVNYRAKHPQRSWTRMTRLVPLFAGGLVVALGLVLPLYWPDGPIPSDSPAIVTFVRGDVTQVAQGEVNAVDVRVREAVGRDATLATSTDGVVMSALAQGSRAALANDSRATVLSERQIRLEHGRIYLDVGASAELFRVNTAEATVTVFGTAFEVAVFDGETTVTVERGVVFVESVSDPTRFRSVYENEQVTTSAADGPSAPIRVNAEDLLAWATSITADTEALALSESIFGPREIAAEDHEGIPHYVSATRNVNGVRIAWMPSREVSGFSDHTIYISEYGGDSIAQFPMPGSVFERSEPTYEDKVYYVVPIESTLLEGRGLIDVKLVPDATTGKGSPSDLAVLFTVP